MRKHYSPVGSYVTPYELTEEQLSSVGRLIRACAEIEDIISVYLCDLASISEGHLVIMLGRSGIQQKLQLARRFAEARGPSDLAEFKDLFEADEFVSVIQCRNTVAHGVLVGATEDGKIAFRTTQITDVSNTKIGVETICYDPEDFGLFATAADRVCVGLDSRLRTGKVRTARKERLLEAHGKTRRNPK